ncbi:MAG: 5'-methylthioadenosine/S-adenosylhomocysteine nucleosidase [Sphaerochaeta sp.]|nr:5'-methylthioadenosine/S-adenosylhomocysteine nucleosidase [Sphaerochaeta sp.]
MALDCLVVASTGGELEGFLTKPDTLSDYKGKSYLLTVIGVSQVQSALNTLVAIMEYQPKRVLLVGYAGGIDAQLAIGDCVLATEVIQYELDLRAFGLKRGETLSRVPNEVLGELSLFVPPYEKAILARGGSSDRFLLRPWREANPYLVDELDLGFSDMESYGVALAAKMQNIPCTVCRVISDDAKGHRPKNYKNFCMKANQMFVEVLYSLLELPSEKSPTNL